MRSEPHQNARNGNPFAKYSSTACASSCLFGASGLVRKEFVPLKLEWESLDDQSLPEK
jgi:hypothetical protein